MNVNVVKEDGACLLFHRPMLIGYNTRTLYIKKLKEGEMLSTAMFDELRAAEAHAARLRLGPVITTKYSLEDAANTTKSLEPGKAITIQEKVLQDICEVIASELPENCTLILNKTIPVESAIATIKRLKPNRILILDKEMPVENMRQIVTALPDGCIYKLDVNTSLPIAKQVVVALPKGCMFHFAAKTPRRLQEALIPLLPVKYITEPDTTSIYDDLFNDAFNRESLVEDGLFPEVAIELAKKNKPGDPVLFEKDVSQETGELVLSNLGDNSVVIFDPEMPEAAAQKLTTLLKPSFCLMLDNNMPFNVMKSIVTVLPKGVTLILTERIPEAQRRELIEMLPAEVSHRIKYDEEPSHGACLIM